MPEIELLPQPRRLSRIPGSLKLMDHRLIVLNRSTPDAGASAGLGGLRVTALRFQDSLRIRLGLFWQLAAGANPGNQTGLVLTCQAVPGLPAQGYHLSVSAGGIRAQAGDEAGLFYAVCTLIQLIEQFGDDLPYVEIEDWPDFPVRGVMLDISRDKVPTLETLFALVDMLASWKINQFQLYTEHTFAYRHHAAVWQEASPLTGQDVMALDAYCQERFVTLVPNQNSFGHMERWLKHPAYTSLAETTAGYQAPWGWINAPNSLCPTDPRSLDLVAGLYDELLPHFRSQMVNVGCDETFDVGQGRSKAAVDARGAGEVKLDYLLKIYAILKTRGCTMMFWGDIVLEHPELIERLPKDVIALNWGYEADHPYAEQGAHFAQNGIPFYVCPGTSTWSALAGRSDNALANLANAAVSGLRHGAAGYLITDWGDNGHWQPLPVSYLGFAAGAAYAWAYEANHALDLPAVLSRYAFRDRSSEMGCLAYELGNAYQAAATDWPHSSPLFALLQRSIAEIQTSERLMAVNYAAVEGLLDRAEARLERVDPDRPDRSLLLREYGLVIRLLRHACRRGELASDLAQNPATVPQFNLGVDLEAILNEFEQLWLARNRPGGLSDSLARFGKAQQDYVMLGRPIAA